MMLNTRVSSILLCALILLHCGSPVHSRGEESPTIGISTAPMSEFGSSHIEYTVPLSSVEGRLLEEQEEEATQREWLGCFEFRNITCDVPLAAGNTSFDINQACLAMENYIRNFARTSVRLVDSPADTLFHQTSFQGLSLSSTMCYAVQQAYHKCWWCARQVTDVRDDFCQFRSCEDPSKQNKTLPSFIAEYYDQTQTCDQLEAIYEQYNGRGYPATIEFCHRAEYASHTCPYFCEPDYLGANTRQEKAVLVWLSRAAAFLSLLGGLYIIQDVAPNPKNRKTVYHQLLLAMAIFDVITALAWGFSTAPIPSENFWVYGATGNSWTCTTQGFFIQLGYISIFYNCSLSLYYLLVIVYGWKEYMLVDINPFLHGFPLSIGLVLAVAGIPIYDWYEYGCHIVPPKVGDFWEILVFAALPLGVSILSIVVFMSLVYYKVRAKTQASKKWSLGNKGGAGSNKGNTLQTQVFYQSLWYVLSFMITWPIMFAVYLGEVDVGGPYWLTVIIAFVAPLQGFNNFLVYIRPKFNYWQKRRNSSRRTTKTGYSTSYSSTGDTDGRRSTMLGRFRKKSSRAVIDTGMTQQIEWNVDNPNKPEQHSTATDRTSMIISTNENTSSAEDGDGDFVDPSVQIAAESEEEEVPLEAAQQPSTIKEEEEKQEEEKQEEDDGIDHPLEEGLTSSQ